MLYHIHIISIYGNIVLPWCYVFFPASCFASFSISSSSKCIADCFISPLRCLPLPHHGQITRCRFVPQRPCKKFIGSESHRLIRRTQLTDLVPFPLSSGSHVKLTFPAFRLYLNCESKRLMAPWEILLSPLSIYLTSFRPGVDLAKARCIFTLCYSKQGQTWPSTIQQGWRLVEHSFKPRCEGTLTRS